MANAARQFVESKLNSTKVVVFSATYCPYCTKAKDTLAKFKIPPANYQIIELDQDVEDGEEIKDYLKEITGARSVPRVFIDKKFIGGGDDTVRLDASGELEKMLKDAHAL
uniref:Glutaredoxin-2, mitochondrial n=1 Tax=Romanomermis culicivorax TaxID=13658 RepID=A0A915IY10_ROMCU